MNTTDALRLKLDATAAAYSLLGERDLPALLREAASAITPPEGYVLVPVEPTQEMLDAGYEFDTGYPVDRFLYSAIIAARPEVSP